MAGSSIAHVCPICKDPVESGDGRVAGLDMTLPGRAPRNIMAHRHCFSGCVMVGPGESFDQAVAASKADALVQAQLAL